MSSIVLFDGVCNFCERSVNFIIRHDRERRFKFAPLQSEIGQELRAKYEIAEDVDSIVLIEDDEAFTNSTAGLRIAKGLGGIWLVAYVFIIVPAFIRDFFYRLFAKYRYRLFGKKDVCMIPTPDVRERFSETVSYSLETLEYAKLLELVSRNAQTPMGVERFALLRPLANRRELDTALTAITETIVLNEEKQVSWSFSGLEDPSERRRHPKDQKRLA